VQDSVPFPIVDHHAHLRPGPAGIEEARRFAKLGGTHLFLATQNYLDHPPSSLDEYREQFDTTLKISAVVQEEAGIKVYPVLAPYPVDMIERSHLGLERAEELQVESIGLAGRYVREGRAVALGEVGRAHFPVEEPLRTAQERILAHAMVTAKDVGCPLVLHTEDLDGAGYSGLATAAQKVGFPVGKLIKHYARSYLPPSSRSGLVPSFLAKREVVQRALGDDGPWFLETDYLDDPSRPGAVLALETVPKRVAWIRSLDGGQELVERMRIPFVDSPKKVYGLELERA
jgi:TatD-related deoxyribonuclease